MITIIISMLVFIISGIIILKSELKKVGDYIESILKSGGVGIIVGIFFAYVLPMQLDNKETVYDIIPINSEYSIGQGDLIKNKHIFSIEYNNGKIGGNKYYIVTIKDSIGNIHVETYKSDIVTIEYNDNYKIYVNKNSITNNPINYFSFDDDRTDITSVIIQVPKKSILSNYNIVLN